MLLSDGLKFNYHAVWIQGPSRQCTVSVSTRVPTAVRGHRDSRVSCAKRPLAERLIALTAPAPYDGILCKHIEAAGAEPLYLSVIQTVKDDFESQLELARFIEWANASAEEHIRYKREEWTASGKNNVSDGRSTKSSVSLCSEWQQSHANMPRMPQLAGIIFSSRNAIDALASALQSHSLLSHKSLRASAGSTLGEDQVPDPETAMMSPQVGISNYLKDASTSPNHSDHSSGLSSLLSLVSKQSPLKIAAMGRDAKLLPSLGPLFHHPSVEIVTALSPATPSAMIGLLGPGDSRMMAAIVPRFEGLAEPPVVHDMIRELRENGWLPLRVNGYVTRAVVPPGEALQRLVSGKSGTSSETEDEGSDRMDRRGAQKGVFDRESGNLLRAHAIVFSSRAEAEGLLKACALAGIDSSPLTSRERRDDEAWRDVVVAAHGPVTARGLEELGVRVDLVSEDCSTLQGVVSALENYFAGR